MKRQAPLLLGAIGASVLAALAVSLLVSPRYRASCLVRAEFADGARPDEASVAAELTERRLRAVRQRVLALGEASSAVVGVTTGGVDAYALECVHAEASGAARVCNEVARRLVEESANVRARGAEGDPQVLAARLAEARRTMEERAEALRLLRAKATGDPGEGLEALARDYDRAWKDYVAIEEQWRAAETASRLGRGGPARFAVLEPAAVPPAPFRPNRLLFALIGAAFGLVVGLGAAVRAERRNPTIDGPEDLHKMFREPILARIPPVTIRRSFWFFPGRRGSRRA